MSGDSCRRIAGDIFEADVGPSTPSGHVAILVIVGPEGDYGVARNANITVAVGALFRAAADMSARKRGKEAAEGVEPEYEL